MSDHEEVEREPRHRCLGCGYYVDEVEDGYCPECVEAGTNDGEKQDANWRANNPS